LSEISETIGPFAWFAQTRTSTRQWLRHHLGLDRAIFFTILGRGWASLAGLVTVALIARCLSPAEQGYYYTFGSLIALQIVFELGFSFVILQMASHERAHLSISAGYQITGDPIAHDRLASVLQKTVRWYSAAAAFLVVLLAFAGSHFFSAHQQNALPVAWRLPWYFAAVAASFTFQLDPILSFMEGCGYVARIARLRFVQAATGSVLAWTSLLVHHGLFAPAMIIVGNAAVAAIWLYRQRALLLPLMRHNPGQHRIRWAQEVWPFQWRIAISWLCGYFIYQLYNPVLFAYHGPIAAGQMGMSLSLVGALLSISIAWINTKAAPFGTLIARKEYAQLDRLFFRSLWQCIGVCTVGCIAIWLGVFYLHWIGSPFARRLLDPLPLAFLLGTAPTTAITFAEASYLRAHKQEKFLFNSILGAILVGSSTFILGKYYGAQGVALGSFVISLLVGLPLGTYTFIKHRRILHAP
jgi:O-antigen/teichoic acid export membrane protein